MTHDITRHQLLVLAESRGVDPVAAARCIVGPGRDPWRVLIDDQHPAYPRERVEPVPPVHGWGPAQEMARRPVRNVYGTLAAAYGLTLAFPANSPRHKQWADALTARPIDLQHLEQWFNHEQNAVNKRTGRPIVTIEQAREEARSIDMVYLWVDSNDEAWQRKFEKFTRQTPDNSRYTDAGELQASLESADRFAPWVRRIFVVTDNQRPAWLVQHPRVTVIDHRMIIPGHYLPSFNSQAIEPWIHKIPGLSEKFLYANDDMLFGAEMTPDQFFTEDGRALIHAGNCSGGGAYMEMCENARGLLDQKFGKRERIAGWHFIKPYRKSMLAEIEREFSKHLNLAGWRKTRSGKDVAWNCVFWPGYSIEAGYAIQPPRNTTKAQYIGMTSDSAGHQIAKALRDRPHLLCINNSTHENSDRVTAFFDTYFAREPQPRIEDAEVQNVG